jgi:hypothetical protein
MPACAIVSDEPMSNAIGHGSVRRVRSSRVMRAPVVGSDSPR